MVMLTDVVSRLVLPDRPVSLEEWVLQATCQPWRLTDAALAADTAATQTSATSPIAQESGEVA